MGGDGPVFDSFVARIQNGLMSASSSAQHSTNANAITQSDQDHSRSLPNNVAVKREPSPSLSNTSIPGGSFSADVSMEDTAASPETRTLLGLNFNTDMNLMSDIPPRHRGHRRAHSEIPFRLPDDVCFEHGEPALLETPSVSDEACDDLFSMYIDVDQLNSSAETLGSVNGSLPASGSHSLLPSHHMRSISMDGVDSHSGNGSGKMTSSKQLSASLEKIKQEYPTLESLEVKKAMAANKLAELALIDPKRVKRILANRQSAARSKERKTRYIAELEQKVQILQTEATTLSAQLTMLQRDTSGLTSENSELKLRLQSMEQQAHLCDALNDALREEVQRLKVVTGQMNCGNGELSHLQQRHIPDQPTSFHVNGFGGLLSTGVTMVSAESRFMHANS
ncbi:hypothetical protein L7F22_032829 [Adiantum nelumboides]|nr:hypothetical protein [Adiantum nelumboides]